MRARLELSMGKGGGVTTLGTRHKVEVKSGLVYLTFPDVNRLTLIIDEKDLAEWKAQIENSKRNSEATK